MIVEFRQNKIPLDNNDRIPGSRKDILNMVLSLIYLLGLQSDVFNALLKRAQREQMGL